MRIGKCDCGGEKFIVGINYFRNWKQHKCRSCGKIFGVGFDEWIQEEAAENLCERDLKNFLEDFGFRNV